MAGYLTINEVSRITGLANHTIRYYEKQFPLLLDVERSKGGHRQYLPRHLESLQAIISLLKEHKLSIRAAREMLGEPEAQPEPQIEAVEEGKNAESVDLSRALLMVLDRLDRLCLINERRDTLLEKLVGKPSGSLENKELLEQIARCRNETKETMQMYQTLMKQWKN